MKVVVISTSQKNTRAEIAVIANGKSVTRHVVLKEDGKFHWLSYQVEGREVKLIDEAYAL